jgi:hypothetical protein
VLLRRLLKKEDGELRIVMKDLNKGSWNRTDLDYSFGSVNDVYVALSIGFVFSN